MKKIALLVLALVCVSSFGVAGGDFNDVKPAVEPVVPMAEEDKSAFYLGLGISAVSTRDADISVDWSGTTRQDRLGNYFLLAGYDFNEYFAVEGRYTNSFTHDDQTVMSGWSLFTKPQYPVSEDFSVYVLVGYGRVTLDGVNGYLVDYDDTDFQWGVGASYRVMENFSLFADYTFLANDMDGSYGGSDEVKLDVDMFSVGITYHF